MLSTFQFYFNIVYVRFSNFPPFVLAEGVRCYFFFFGPVFSGFILVKIVYSFSCKVAR